ncbi:uncharacterized protein PSFLO_06940 [Pseudozyma flocculosa]|uniref:WW domain-containing protein n=1 Tax=Pseudozyma flocculosa TaxID=84751 RepID=A0A5C3FAG6_9BASI|nr:uncharacterized protein PSFLO_06940 [Pseudozyma flocculosa]
MSQNPPPLPPGWTQHTAPTGHAYFYHAQSGTSTYTHPALAQAVPLREAPAIRQDGQLPKPRKEKPRRKDPIPGAEGWLRVITNLDNVFYFHTESRRSLWTVPDEIKEQVAAMQRAETDAPAAADPPAPEARSPTQMDTQSVGGSASGTDAKRKAEEGVPLTTFEAPAGAKRARVDSASEVDVAESLDGQSEGDADDEGDEAWQRAMAAEMAAEAELLEDPHPPPQASPPAEPPAAGPDSATAQGSGADSASSAPSQRPNHGPFIPPPSIELSQDEAKALFMRMLTSLNDTPNEVNPMAPWDKELPKFVHQPAYSILPQLRDRQDAFNEWCKLRIREKRAVKYRQLLESEVKSTRTRFDDFRKAWRKDRRFFEFGRDDRERERAFKSWLQELGERKRKAALAAEADFLDLLSSKLSTSLAADLKTAVRSNNGNETEAVAALWRDAKRTPDLDTDSRYDAVGSSTRRAELFAEWLKGRRRAAGEPHDEARGSLKVQDKQQSKQESTRQALRERENKVRRERAAVEARNRAAYGAATRGDSHLQFQQLLLDAIRDATDEPLSSPSIQGKLSGDPRFEAPGLSRRDKDGLYQEHLQRLRRKRRAALRDVFKTHAPELDAERDDVLARVKEDVRMGGASLSTFLGDEAALADEYGKWIKDREATARQDFFDMLKESAFVEFWGRMRKEALAKSTDDNVGHGRGDDINDEGEEEEATLIDMARKVDLNEIEAVLRNDQRYRMWRHLPHKREEWIRAEEERL